MNLLVEQNYLDSCWREKLTALLDSKNLQKTSDCFLLRLGRHSGAEAMTLNGTRSIKIMQGRNEKPKNQNASKTVWLASPDKDSRRDLIPFGWVLVEVDAIENRISDGIVDSDQALQTWHGKVSEKVAHLRSEQEKRTAAQREQEERERLKQQEEDKRQKVIEAQLQSLSPLARELETRILNQKWESDKNAFWKPGEVESWLEKLEGQPEPSVLDRLTGLFRRHFPGALENPDKTQGKKKNRPAFKDRVRQVAKALNALTKKT